MRAREHSQLSVETAVLYGWVGDNVGRDYSQVSVQPLYSTGWACAALSLLKVLVDCAAV